MYSNAIYSDECSNPKWKHLYLNSRKKIINHANDKTIADIDHRNTVFLPGFKRWFPSAYYLVLWRDFDETVVSLSRWGCYHWSDIIKRWGRVKTPYSDYRRANAWYWITIYKYILKHKPEYTIFIPFEWVRNQEIEKLQAVFWAINVEVPSAYNIRKVLNKKHNQTKRHKHIRKTWHHLDKEAEQITERLMELS